MCHFFVEDACVCVWCWCSLCLWLPCRTRDPGSPLLDKDSEGRGFFLDIRFGCLVELRFTTSRRVAVQHSPVALRCMLVVCPAVEKGVCFCQLPVGVRRPGRVFVVGRRVGGTRLNDVKESQPFGNRLFGAEPSLPCLRTGSVRTCMEQSQVLEKLW